MKRKPVTRQEKLFLAALPVALVLVAIAAYLEIAPRFSLPENTSAFSCQSLLEAAQVDLNTAGLEALCTLPGIGEKKAQAIIDDRRANGPYEQLEDVTRVSGITRNTIAKWAGMAYVS